MSNVLFIAIPIVMLGSAIVGGIFYFKRNITEEIRSLDEGCRIIETMISSSRSENRHEAQTHMLTARSQLESAQTARAEGSTEAAFAAVDAGFRALRQARLLVQRPDSDQDAD